MFAHALWLVGFRPFFALSFVSGVALAALWALSYSGAWPIVPPGLSTLQWHAHEMLFGFGFAVLGGFLLTASKNWVKIRGLHGAPLALAVLFWIVERFALFLPNEGALGLLRLVLLNACVLYVGGYIVSSLVRYRKQDAYPDNGFFIVGLAVFLVAKNLLLTPTTWLEGMTLSIGIFRLAFAVMFERTLTQFMKNAMTLELPVRPALDLSIKGLILLAAFEALLPAPIAVVVLSAAALLLFARWLTWRPLAGLSTFGIGIMYVGYLGLVVHLVLAALRYGGVFTGIGSLSTHAFAFLTMGLVIPGMLIRICQGHTGRKLLFTVSDRVAIGAMGLAAAFRLIATQVWPAHYVTWIAIAAAGWALCFCILGVRLIPFLFAPRVDGKVH